MKHGKKLQVLRGQLLKTTTKMLELCNIWSFYTIFMD